MPRFSEINEEFYDCLDGILEGFVAPPDAITIRTGVDAIYPDAKLGDDLRPGYTRELDLSRLSEVYADHVAGVMHQRNDQPIGYVAHAQLTVSLLQKDRRPSTLLVMFHRTLTDGGAPSRLELSAAGILTATFSSENPHTETLGVYPERANNITCVMSSPENGGGHTTMDDFFEGYRQDLLKLQGIIEKHVQQAPKMKEEE